jgi:hypothetical protein
MRRPSTPAACAVGVVQAGARWAGMGARHLLPQGVLLQAHAWQTRQGAFAAQPIPRPFTCPPKTAP